MGTVGHEKSRLVKKSDGARAHCGRKAARKTDERTITEKGKGQAVRVRGLSR
jgi:hypothetical protein